MSTVREHLEAIRDRHVDEADWMIPICHLCDGDWPCLDHRDAVAALAMLDAAERLGRVSQRVWPADDRVAVPDPEPAT